MENTNFIRGKVLCFKMHPDKRKDSFFLYSKSLVDVIKEGLKGKKNVYWLGIEKMMKVLFSQHYCRSIPDRFSVINCDLNILKSSLELDHFVWSIIERSFMVLVIKDFHHVQPIITKTMSLPKVPHCPLHRLSSSFDKFIGEYESRIFKNK